MKCWLFSIVATCVVAISTPANAGFVTVDCDADDYRYGMGIPPTTYPYTVHIGAGSNPNVHQANFFYIFQLPTLASNQVVSSADLSFRYTYNNFTLNYNVDLWGVGFQGSTAPITEFFNNNTGDTGNTKIGDNLITPSTSRGAISTDALEDAALGNYVQSFYDANPGYSGGDYVFLRLNHDSPTPGSANFIQVSNSGSSVGSPVLTLDVTTAPVPEPSTLAIWSLLGLCSFGLYRRRKA